MAELLALEVAVKRYHYLMLDTCVLINEFKCPSGIRILPKIARGQRRTSIVALWEFFHGRPGATLSSRERAERDDWLRDQGIGLVDLHKESSKTFRSLLRTDRGPPALADCLLAAESLARKWPLVTANLGDFGEVARLRVVPV